jgi:hypothetical protein
MGFGKRRSGDFLPLLKYDARAGSLFLEDRVQTPNGWEKQQTDIGSRFRAVFDLANAEIGWIKFAGRGSPPETILVPVGQDIGKPPSDDHKQGIRLLALMDKSLGGDIREFMSTAAGAWNGFSALHDAYLAELGGHPGQLPIAVVDEIVERQFANGSSFEPSFKIAGWVPRPDEFGPEKGPSAKRAQARQPRDMDDEIPF